MRRPAPVNSPAFIMSRLLNRAAIISYRFLAAVSTSFSFDLSLFEMFAITFLLVGIPDRNRVTCLDNNSQSRAMPRPLKIYALIRPQRRLPCRKLKVRVSEGEGLKGRVCSFKPS